MNKVSKRILKLALPYMKIVLLGLFFSLLYSSMYPLFLKLLEKFLRLSLVKKEVAHLNTFPLIAFFCFLVLGAFSFCQQYFMAKAGNKMIMHLRASLYEHLQSLSLSFYHRRRVGDLMSRMTNDVSILQQVLTASIMDQVSSFFLFVSLFVFMMMTNWLLTLLTFIALPLIGFAYRFFALRIQRSATLFQESLGDLTSLMQENLSGIKTIQAFGREEKEKEKFRRMNVHSYATAMKNIKVLALLTPIIELLAVVGLSLALWIGAKEVVTGRLDIAELFTYFAAALLISGPMRRISRGQGIWTQAKASAQRIFEIMDEVPEIQDSPEALALEQPRGEVAFEHVWFSYKAEKSVLKDISFEVKAGECVALVGPSGAGKTTISDLVPRFYDPQKGRVLLDNIDLRRIKVKDVRDCIAIVPQEPLLFAGTLRENLLYGGKDVSDEEFQSALEQAQCADFIPLLPKGLDTIVGERGITLSGGEKQRIAIARALLKKPRVLILDEPTSSLDALSEEKMRLAFAAVMRGRTTFVIAHRLSTVQMADRILVIEQGRIIEEGSHAVLLQREGLYAQLYRAQFKESSNG